MKQLATKIKPAGGFSNLFHMGLLALLPALIFIMVRIEFPTIAIALIILSKWRMFAVRPRHWPANVRANGIDLIVGISVIVFMTHSQSQLMQLIWATMYGIWLIWIKPSSGTLMVSIQAMIGQLAGLMALYLAWGGETLGLLVLGTGLICYVAARHFLTSFDEPLTRLLAYIWAYFGAALAWILGHWLLFYGVVAQPTLLLSVIGFTLATMYYLDHNDRLSTLLKRQFIFMVAAIIVVVLVFSDWGDKTI